MAVVAEHIDYKQLFEEQKLITTLLLHELDQLKKMIFGAKQERFIPGAATDPTQIAIGLRAEQVVATSLIMAKKIEYTRNQAILTSPAITHQGSMRLPDHLERKEILLDVEGKQGCLEIGQEVTEELEYNCKLKFKLILPIAVSLSFLNATKWNLLFQSKL
ncbi:transposase domain-containing protein [Flavitalea flava]